MTIGSPPNSSFSNSRDPMSTRPPDEHRPIRATDPDGPAIHPLLARRYSPRSFTSETLDDATVHALFEAVRWAPSAFNAQPWRYRVARRGSDDFARLAGALKEGNRAWAPDAALLGVAYAQVTKDDGQPNRWAHHDLGLANAALVFEATARGLGVHFMAGFVRETLETAFETPGGFEPVAAFAVGTPGPADCLPQPLADREQAPRSRKPWSEVVIGLDGPG